MQLHCVFFLNCITNIFLECKATHFKTIGMYERYKQQIWGIVNLLQCRLFSERECPYFPKHNMGQKLTVYYSNILPVRF